MRPSGPGHEFECPVEPDVLTVVSRRGLSPKRAHCVDVLVCPCAAIIKLGAECLELLTQPAHPNTEPEAALSHRIKSGSLLGEKDRVPLRSHRTPGATFAA